VGAKAAMHWYRHHLGSPHVRKLTFSKSIGRAFLPPRRGCHLHYQKLKKGYGGGQKFQRFRSSTYTQSFSFLHSFFRQYWVGGNPCLGVSASTSAWLRLQIFTNLGKGIHQDKYHRQYQWKIRSFSEIAFHKNIPANEL